MTPRRRAPLLRSFAACLALLASPLAAHSEPAAELAAFSAFKNLDVNKLAGGKVQMLRGPSMSFPRGLAVESCYVIPKPLAKATDFHQRWNAQRHAGVRAWIHGSLPGRPAAEDFKALASAPSNGSVKSFVAATEKLGNGSTPLQLSAAEARPVGSGMPAVAGFWSNALAQRASAFSSGGLGKLPPYETTGEPARAAEDAARLLKEAGKIRGQFAGLIDATPLGGGRGGQPTQSYWELFDVEGQAAVSLGAQYAKAAGASWQAVDVQYYSSGGFYVLLTFHQMWPVNVGGQDATLVWRGDLISAAQLGTLRGVERMGSGSAMMRETQKAIDLFLKDAADAK